MDRKRAELYLRDYSIKSVIEGDNFFGLRVWNITVITLHVYMYRYMLLVVISQISMGTPTGAIILSIISTDCLSITDLAQWHIDPPTFKTFSQNSSYLCKICFCLTREWICCPKLHAWRKSQGMHYCDTMYKMCLQLCCIFFKMSQNRKYTQTNIRIHKQQIDQYIHSCDIFTEI